jgi:hypothetical protein
VVLFVLFAANVVRAQEDPIPKERLWSPATKRARFVGETHDSYVINARKGQTMTVRISGRRERGNWAHFTVSKSPDFFEREQDSFGTKSGDRWTAKIPKPEIIISMSSLNRMSLIIERRKITRVESITRTRSNLNSGVTFRLIG